MIHLVGAIAFGLAFGLGLGAVVLALGERARSLLRVPVPPGVRPAAAFTFGSLVLGTAVLALGLVGLFRPVALLVLAAAAALAGRWRALPRLVRPLRFPVLASLPLLPVALAPPFFYDSWVYHLGLPWQALQDQALRGHEGNLFSTFPPLAQLIYAIPLGAGALRAAGVVHLIGYLTASAAVTAIARHLGAGRAVSILAGIAALYLPGAMLVPALPAAEAWSFAAVMVSVAVALTGRGARASGIGSGAAAGAACAARLQGLTWAILSGMLLAARFARRSPRALVYFSTALLAGATPWWLKNTLLLGQPLAPLGWRRSGTETLWRDAASNINLAAGTADLISRVTGALGRSGALVVPLLIVALLASAMDRRAKNLVVLAAVTFGWIAWGLTGALDRFLTPTLALLLALVAASGRPRWVRPVSAIAIVGVLAWGGWNAAKFASAIGGVRVAGEAERVYASTVVSDPSPAFRACARLQPDARLLLVSEPRGFLLPRRFETSSQHDPSPFAALLEQNATAAGARTELRRLGFTHVLINLRELSRLGASYPVRPWSSPAGRDRFVELTRLLGPPVVLDHDVVVYALDERPPEK